jgi:hypothetical protein
VANTLAYYDMATITTVKSFIEQGPAPIEVLSTVLRLAFGDNYTWISGSIAMSKTTTDFVLILTRAQCYKPLTSVNYVLSL